MTRIFQMNKIYYEILDFVTKVKKLEYCLLLKHEYVGESVFRGVWDNKIPRKGTIEFEDKQYDYFFHGTGVDFTSGEERLQYNRSLNNGLGVHFTPMIHHDYRSRQKEIDKGYEDLVNQNLIKQWMPEIPLSKVFYLI